MGVLKSRDLTTRHHIARVDIARLDNLSLPHVEITKTERNRTKNFNSISSTYNTQCSKYKLVRPNDHLLEHRNKSRDVRSRVFSRPLFISRQSP